MIEARETREAREMPPTPMMPASFDAELAVLSACFLTPAAVDGARELLVADDFYSESHRALFRAIGAVANRGGLVDPISVADELTRTDTLALVGGKEYIGRLLDTVPTASNLEYYTTILREKTALRKTLVAIRAAGRAAIEGQAFTAIDTELERSLALIRARGAGDRIFDDKATMADGALAYLRGARVSGVPYGFAPLDRVLLPIQAGHFILIGGASSSGKSTVVRNLVRQWAQRFNETVGLLSIEMSGQEQLEALALIEANVSVERYYRQQLTEPERERVAEAIGLWRDTTTLRLNEQGAVTPEQALRMFRRWRSEGVTLFVVDHLHRLDYGATRDGELRLPMANFARALKSFAKDYECRVIALVQYSKIKPHEEPDDSKIRESNNILEESDGVLHIYRPLVACQRSHTGQVVPIQREGAGGRYFEGEAPAGTVLAHDPEYVYVKLGKQRRRIRDGMIRIPFNADTWALYDGRRES